LETVVTYIVGGRDYGSEEAFTAEARRERERIADAEATVERRILPVVVAMLVDVAGQVRYFDGDDRSRRLLALVEADAARVGVSIAEHVGEVVPFDRSMHKWAGETADWPRDGDAVTVLTPVVGHRSGRVLSKGLVGSA
jgi:hypothetical protein